MATLDENLRTHVLADPGVAAEGPTEMALNLVPEGDASPYLWYQRTNEETAMDADGSPGITTVRYSIEAISKDVAQAVRLGTAARKSLFGFKGYMGENQPGNAGDTWVGYCMVEDIDDSYESQGSTDEGEHVYAFTCEIQFKGD